MSHRRARAASVAQYLRLKLTKILKTGPEYDDNADEIDTGLDTGYQGTRTTQSPMMKDNEETSSFYTQATPSAV